MVRKTRVIVTGLSGLIGQRFQQLYGDKCELVNVDLTTGIDITNVESVKKILGESRAEVVLHLAAFTDVAAAHGQHDNKKGLCYRINVDCTHNVAQYSNQFDKFLIHVSTDFIFSGKKDRPYTEDDSPDPVDWYGTTKFLAEQEVQKAGENHTILLLAFPYQAKPVRPDLVSKIAEQLKTGTLPPQFGDNFITPTFVDDLCAVFNYCINQRSKGIYHAVGSSWHSSYEVASMVKERFHLSGEIKKASIVEFVRTTGRPFPHKLRLSNEKLKRDFQLSMRTFNDGLTEVFQQQSISD